MTMPRRTRPSGQAPSPGRPAPSTAFWVTYRLSASITSRDVGEIDDAERLSEYRCHQERRGAGSSRSGGYRVTCSAMSASRPSAELSVGGYRLECRDTTVPVPLPEGRRCLIRFDLQRFDDAESPPRDVDPLRCRLRLGRALPTRRTRLLKEIRCGGGESILGFRAERRCGDRHPQQACDELELLPLGAALG